MRTYEWVRVLPDPLEWYLRPVAGRTNFTLFPWAGFVMAGALIGVVITRADDEDAERRVMAGLAAAGLVLALSAYRLSFLPQVFDGSNFWTSSPTFFFLRVGLLILAVPLAWLWSSRLGRSGSWRPLEIFGRSSLFVYWIHVEMVYGVLSRPLHRSLTLRGALVAFAAFTLFLFGLVLLKNALTTRLHAKP
jgi:surface polysaccharide O-acyltransferase-like enzyme